MSDDKRKSRATRDRLVTADIEAGLEEHDESGMPNDGYFDDCHEDCEFCDPWLVEWNTWLAAHPANRLTMRIGPLLS